MHQLIQQQQMKFAGNVGKKQVRFATQEFFPEDLAWAVVAAALIAKPGANLVGLLFVATLQQNPANSATWVLATPRDCWAQVVAGF